MEFTIPFEKGAKHTRNMIIAHAEHKTTYQVLVDITQLKYASCLPVNKDLGHMSLDLPKMLFQRNKEERKSNYTHFTSW